ncbi:penicillin-binding protein 1A [Salmonella enterica subsp. enterica]|uniref:Penicillin-binding protein 1A n=1 Tax=Salmonella enterica I TaxID=59201 RepID=A0A379W1D2_SALET|nr:penicillin-binding protein 1A [Salmonella enterica subsp. enterica]
MIFEAKPKIACPECDIPVIYGNTQKSDVLENTNVEEVAVSQEQQNSAVPMPELEQANQALVAQNGTQEYAPHVINTPLAFLIKSALNTNIFGEPGWMGTGWRARVTLNVAISAAKPVQPTARKTHGSPAMVLASSLPYGSALTITAVI